MGSIYVFAVYRGVKCDLCKVIPPRSNQIVNPTMEHLMIPICTLSCVQRVHYQISLIFRTQTLLRAQQLCPILERAKMMNPATMMTHHPTMTHRIVIHLIRIRAVRAAPILKLSIRQKTSKK